MRPELAFGRTLHALLLAAAALASHAVHAQGPSTQRFPRDRFAVLETFVNPVTLDGGLTYVQDFTHPNLAEFRAAMFLVTGATALGAVTPHSRYSYGFCDDSGRQAVMGGRVRDNFAKQDARMVKSSVNVVGILAEQASTLAALGTFDSVVQDGIRIRWTRTISGDTSPLSIEPYRITCLLIGGVDDGTQASVGLGGGPLPGTFLEDDVGIEADFYVLLASFGTIGAGPNIGTFDWLSVGFASRRTELPQGALGHAFLHDLAPPPPFSNAKPSDSRAFLATDGVMAVPATEPGRIHHARMTAIGPEGFEYSANDLLHY
jgi:hypothetical protein